MGGYSLEDMRNVARDCGAGDSNMLSGVSEGKRDVIDCELVGCLQILHIGLHSRRSKYLQFSFLWCHLHLVLPAIQHGKVQKMTKKMEVVGHKDSVICTTNRGDRYWAKIDSKIRLLGSGELLIVVNFVFFSTVRTTFMSSSFKNRKYNY